MRSCRDLPHSPTAGVANPCTRRVLWALTTLALLVPGCGTTGDGAPDAGAATADATTATPDAGPDRWEAVRAAVDDHEIPDLTLLVGDATGTLLVYEKGNSTATTEYRIASATKWITAATFMQLVDKGHMSLDDNPQDYLTFWTAASDDSRSRVTLDQLLSFTSGYRGSPGLVPCVKDESSTIAECVPKLYDNFFAYEPGTTFHYGPAHMHTAALMAETATGKSWPQIVADEIGTPLGVADTFSWALTSETHPMPSGGLQTTGASYAKFLTALLAGDLLAGYRAEMATPRTVSSTIGSSPIDEQYGTWTYALGQWRECPDATWTAACDSRVISSSPGAFGFYPWMDHDRGYWAVIAVELPFQVGNKPTERSVPLGLQLQPLIEAALAN